MQVNKQQLELDKEQLPGSKLGKEYDKSVYCHPADLIYMKNNFESMNMLCLPQPPNIHCIFSQL